MFLLNMLLYLYDEISHNQHMEGMIVMRIRVKTGIRVMRMVRIVVMEWAFGLLGWVGVLLEILLIFGKIFYMLFLCYYCVFEC